MKNLKFVGIIAFVAVIMLSVVGCSTISVKESESGYAPSVGITVKDFEALGVVRVQTVIDDKGNGERITFDALLREAEKLGGNGIANVTIDKQSEIKVSPFGRSPGTTTYYGSALAIKYTNTIANATASSSDGYKVPSGGFSLFGK